MPRDLIAEIEAIRARTQVTDHYIVAFSLKTLEAQVSEVSRDDSAVLGYFAVATVAHLQVFFRHALRDILDLGEPFLGRCDRLIKDGRFTFDSAVAVALSGRRVTIGELIAAGLSYNDLVRSTGYLGQILEVDFLHAVRKAYEAAPSSEGQTFDNIMAVLQSLYEARHIIAHEVRPELTLNRQRILEWIEAAFSFVFTAAHVIEPVVFPGGIPKTQADATRRASEAAGKEIAMLEGALLKLSQLSPEYRTELQAQLADWLAWARKASLLTSEIQAAGGTVAPMLSNMELQGLAKGERERLEALARTLESR
jgi:hypothetical protein